MNQFEATLQFFDASESSIREIAKGLHQAACRLADQFKLDRAQLVDEHERATKQRMHWKLIPLATFERGRPRIVWQYSRRVGKRVWPKRLRGKLTREQRYLDSVLARFSSSGEMPLVSAYEDEFAALRATWATVAKVQRTLSASKTAFGKVVVRQPTRIAPAPTKGRPSAPAAHAADVVFKSKSDRDY